MALRKFREKNVCSKNCVIQTHFIFSRYLVLFTATDQILDSVIYRKMTITMHFLDRTFCRASCLLFSVVMLLTDAYLHFYFLFLKI